MEYGVAMEAAAEAEKGPWARTTHPTTTTGALIGMKFKGGVAVLADRVTSYGKMARYRNTPRIIEVSPKTVLAVGGDVADFQLIHKRIQMMQMEKKLTEGADLGPDELHSWLSCVLYNRRSKMDPLWLSVMVIGVDDKDEPFLGDVDIRGIPTTGEYIATGFGAYLCRQKLQTTFEAAAKKAGKDPQSDDACLSRAEAVQLLKDCQTVLYYRDTNAYPEADIFVVSKDDGVTRIPNLDLAKESRWEDLANMTRGYE